MADFNPRVTPYIGPDKEPTFREPTNDRYTSPRAQALNDAVQKGEWGTVRAQLTALRDELQRGTGSIDGREAAELLQELGQASQAAKASDHVSSGVIIAACLSLIGAIVLLIGAIIDKCVDGDDEVSATLADDMRSNLEQSLQEHLNWGAPQLTEAQLNEGVVLPAPARLGVSLSEGSKSSNVADTPNREVGDRAIATFRRLMQSLASDGTLDERDLYILAQRLNSSRTLLSHARPADVNQLVNHDIQSFMWDRLPSPVPDHLYQAERAVRDMIISVDGELNLRGRVNEAEILDGGVKRASEAAAAAPTAANLGALRDAMRSYEPNLGGLVPSRLESLLGRIDQALGAVPAGTRSPVADEIRATLARWRAAHQPAAR